MGFTSIWHWIIVLAVVLILFARPGKISGIMGDFGKGLRNFKEGMKPGEQDDEPEDVDVIEAAPAVKPKAPAKKASKSSSKISKKGSQEKGSQEKSKITLASGFCQCAAYRYVPYAYISLL